MRHAGYYLTSSRFVTFHRTDSMHRDRSGGEHGRYRDKHSAAHVIGATIFYTGDILLKEDRYLIAVKILMM